MSDISPSHTPSAATPITPDTSRTLQSAPQAVKRSMPMALSITLGILMAGFLAWFAYELTWFIILLYLSFVIATIIEAPVHKLMTRGIPRTPATVAIMLCFLTLMAAMGYFMFLYVYGQFTAVSQDFQNLPQRINAWLNGLANRWPALGQFLPKGDVTTRLQEIAPSLWSVAENGMKGVGIATYAVVTFFVVTYMVIEGPDHLKGVRRVFPKNARLEVTNVFNDMVTAHRGWFLATVTNMLSSATLTALALWIIGIPGALVLGLIGGLGELVPNIGPLISNSPILLFTLVVSPAKIWMVILAFVIVQSIQGYGISPLMMKRSVRLPVLATIISVLVMGTLFGALGVVVAIPLTADFVVLWNYFNTRLEKDSSDGDQVNSAPTVERTPAPSAGKRVSYWRRHP